MTSVLRTPIILPKSTNIRGFLFGLLLVGIMASPAQAQSTDVLPTETAITLNQTNYACIPESVHWQQALPPGVVGSEDPFQNPPSFESIPGAPHRAYNDMHISIQAAGTFDMADLQLWQCRQLGQ